MDWIILTGEYPPQHGGVSEYTYRLAEVLKTRGEKVTICTPATDGRVAQEGVELCELADQFGRQARRQLEKHFQSSPEANFLLQYVPHSFGLRGINLPFCVWLWWRYRGRIDVMFHEVALPSGSGQRLKVRVAGKIQNLMARLLVRASRHVYISIPGWEPRLKKYLRPEQRLQWLPIASHFDGLNFTSQVRRKAYPVVGHFGTYGQEIGQMLSGLLPFILKRFESVHFALIGRGSEVFLPEFLRRFPEFTDRMYASGPVPSNDVARHLLACDVLIQPFPDGVSTRRSSFMAALALGRPLITNGGHLTEAFWHSTDAVSFSGTFDLEKMGGLLDTLLANSDAAEQMGRRGQRFYEENFSWERTLNVLGCPAQVPESIS